MKNFGFYFLGLFISSLLIGNGILFLNYFGLYFLISYCLEDKYESYSASEKNRFSLSVTLLYNFMLLGFYKHELLFLILSIVLIINILLQYYKIKKITNASLVIILLISGVQLLDYSGVNEVGLLVILSFIIFFFYQLFKKSNYITEIEAIN